MGVLRSRPPAPQSDQTAMGKPPRARRGGTTIPQKLSDEVTSPLLLVPSDQ
jgi:hypothetical protein